MARRKQAEREPTPEEKLQRALVPVEEQPYAVPGNWCWAHIGDIFYLQAGKNINAKDISNEKNALNQYPCFGGNGIRGYVNKYSHDGLYPIIGRQGALCGNINLASGKFYATEHAVPVTCKPIVNKMWAYYCLTHLNLNQYATATAQPGLAVSNIIGVSIALPPLAEQHRIVARIESLFAKLDEAKGKAQAVVDGFELRKSAMLHKAFTGELTEQWRKEHGSGVDSWKKTELGTIIKVSSGKALTSKDMNKYGTFPVYGGNGITGVHDIANVFSDTIVIGRVGFYCGSVHYVSKSAWVTDNALIVSFNSEQFDIRFLFYSY